MLSRRRFIVVGGGSGGGGREVGRENGGFLNTPRPPEGETRALPDGRRADLCRARLSRARTPTAVYTCAEGACLQNVGFPPPPFMPPPPPGGGGGEVFVIFTRFCVWTGPGAVRGVKKTCPVSRAQTRRSPGSSGNRDCRGENSKTPRTNQSGTPR